MKRITLSIMILSLFISLYGCGQTPEPDVVMPTSFYYHTDLDSKEDFNDIFIAEIREGVQYQNDHILLLNSYFSGPESENLVNPFPSGLEAVSFETKGDTAYVVLSEKIAKLSALDLTMACSCLSLTLFELTQCDYVQISAENNFLADQEFITIRRDTLLLSDNTQLPTEN